MTKKNEENRKNYTTIKSLMLTNSVPKKSSLRVRSACSVAWGGTAGSSCAHATAGSMYIRGVNPAKEASSASRTIPRPVPIMTHQGMYVIDVRPGKMYSSVHLQFVRSVNPSIGPMEFLVPVSNRITDV